MIHDIRSVELAIGRYSYEMQRAANEQAGQHVHLPRHLADEIINALRGLEQVVEREVKRRVDVERERERKRRKGSPNVRPTI